MSFSTLAALATTISKGTTPTSIGLAFAESGIPFIRGENVIGGEVDTTSATHYISIAAHKKLNRSALRSGDVLVTIAGTIGRIGFLGSDLQAANCNQAVAFIRCDQSQVCSEWLCLLLRSPFYQSRFGERVAGGAIPNVSLQQIGSLAIPLVGLKEQRQVA
ncbi:MAG: restriction endonuclease subunit S, partial [Dokdonella sp.]